MSMLASVIQTPHDRVWSQELLPEIIVLLFDGGSSLASLFLSARPCYLFFWDFIYMLAIFSTWITTLHSLDGRWGYSSYFCRWNSPLTFTLDYVRDNTHQCWSYGQYHDPGLEHNWRESIKLLIDQLGGVYRYQCFLWQVRVPWLVPVYACAKRSPFCSNLLIGGDPSVVQTSDRPTTPIFRFNASAFAQKDVLANTATFRTNLALFSANQHHSSLLYYPFDMWVKVNLVIPLTFFSNSLWFSYSAEICIFATDATTNETLGLKLAQTRGIAVYVNAYLSNVIYAHNFRIEDSRQMLIQDQTSIFPLVWPTLSSFFPVVTSWRPLAL